MHLFTNIKKALASVIHHEGVQVSKDRAMIFAPLVDNDIDSYTRQEYLRVGRYLENNFSFYKNLIETIGRYCISTGIIHNPSTIDEKFNKEASTVFDKWASSRFCTATGNMTFWQLQRLIAERLIADGEVFLLLTKSKENYPQLQVLDPTIIKSSHDDTVAQDGIYYDKIGRAVAYSVQQVDGSFKRINGDNIIHIQDIKKPSQKRGIPWAASSFNTIRDIKDIFKLEKNNVKTSQLIVGTISNPDGSSSLGKGGLFGDLQQNASSSTPNISSSQVETVIGSGKFVDIGKSKLEMLKTERPSPSFNGFLETLHRDICNSIGIPYEFSYSPEKLTGASMRFIIQSTDNLFREIQDLLIEACFQRIYIWVISVMVNNKKLELPTTDEWFSNQWSKPVSLSIDLQRASNIEIEQLNNGLTTYEDYYNARGKNAKEQIIKWLNEKKFITEEANNIGVILDGDKL